MAAAPAQSPAPPRHEAANKWLIAVAVMLATIMEVIDTTIANVALLHIRGSLSAGVDEAAWVLTSYIVANAIIIPLTGWCGAYFGRKRFFIFSILLFVFGSLMAGAAPNLQVLVFCRVLQGLGGGAMMPMSQAILMETFPPEQQAVAMSVWGMGMMIGPVGGPILGGWITDNYSWRWIFYINVPIGIIALVLAARWLPGFDTDERVPSAFDTVGFCLLSPGLALLLYALSEVGTTGSYTSTSVLVGFFLGVLLMVGFILHALRVKNPLLELHPFKNRNFSIANICIFVIGATLFGSMFLLPIYYQVARGQEAWQAGLLMAPQGIGAACVMRWAGSVTDRLGPRRVVPFGILLMAAATVPFAFVTTSTSEAWLAVTLFARGVGLGLSMMPVMAAAYYDLNHAEIPKATTVLNIVRLIGGSVATATFAVVLERQIISNLTAAGIKVHAGSAGVIGATAKLPPPVADPVAAAFAHTFWWSVGAILLAFIPTLFLPNHAPGAAQGGDAATEDVAGADDDRVAEAMLD